MKTINFQLSSQKCLDEGWTVRPASPVQPETPAPDAFEVEPVDWMSASDETLDDGESPFAAADRTRVRAAARPFARSACASALGVCPANGLLLGALAGWLSASCVALRS